MMTDQHWMGLAIEAARRGMVAGQTPFGACIVRDGKALACEHNIVWASCDATAHAEVHAIRRACARIQSIDLGGAVIYSTCEPCPMCFSACHWAKLSRIVYGASIADARDAGFSELTISNQQMKQEGGSPIEIVGGVMRDRCVELFTEWAAMPGRRTY